MKEKITLQNWNMSRLLLNWQTRSSWNSDRLSTSRMVDKNSYIFGVIGSEGDILPAQFINYKIKPMVDCWLCMCWRLWNDSTIANFKGSTGYSLSKHLVDRWRVECPTVNAPNINHTHVWQTAHYFVTAIQTNI
jgi:hypothetical protein